MFIVSIRNGQPSEPALCQLYRHTFLPCIQLTYYGKPGAESDIYDCYARFVFTQQCNF